MIASKEDSTMAARRSALCSSMLDRLAYPAYVGMI
jgi:hypothetical protein